MRVTDTDLPNVVQLAEEQNKRDLPIIVGDRSQNTSPFGGDVSHIVRIAHPS